MLIFSILLLAFCASLPASSDIIIKGNKVIPAEKIQSMIDQVFDLDEAQETLHGSGLFENTRIYKDGGNYVVEVEEKRIISNIIFVVDGDEKHKSDFGPSYDTLIQVTALKPGSIIDSQRILTAKTRLNGYYKMQNYEYARVRHEIVERQADADSGQEAGCHLYVYIDLGPKYEIENVKFIGLKELSAEALRKCLTPRIKNYLLFAVSSPEPYMLQSDFEQLVDYANDEGFLHAKVKHAFVETVRDDTKVYNKNRQRIYIEFDEGPLCTIGNVTIKSQDSLKDIHLFAKPISGVANSYRTDEYAQALLKAYKDDGHNVIVSYEKKFRCAQCHEVKEHKCAKDIVDLTFSVDPVSNKYVISKILVKGNAVTKTNVILRAAKLTAGSYFDHRKLSLVEARVRRLGFFKFVNVQYFADKEPGSYIIVINVEDQASGQIGLQGSMSLDKNWEFALGFFYQHPNFLGTGNEVMLNITAGQTGDTMNFAFKSPTLFDRDIGWFVNGYYTTNQEKSSYIDHSCIDSKYKLPNGKKHANRPKKLADNIRSVAYSTKMHGLMTGVSYDLYSYGVLRLSIGAEGQTVRLIGGFEDEKNISRFFKKDWFPQERTLLEVACSYGIGKSYHKKQNVTLSSSLSLSSDGHGSFAKFSPKLKFHYPLNRSQSIYISTTLSYGYMHVFSQKYYWVDHFESSEVYLKGLTQIGPTERNRYTQIGGTQKFNAYAELITPVGVPLSIKFDQWASLPTSFFTMFFGVYAGSLWGTSILHDHVLPQYAKYRNWHLDTPDIASQDFKLRATLAAGLRFNLGPLKLEWSMRHALSKNDETDTFKWLDFKITF